MNSDWPHTTIHSIQEFLAWLTDDNLHRERVYRGQADSGWYLQPSLDRKLQDKVCFEERVRKEKEYIDCFCDQARPFLDEHECRYLADPDDRVLRMTLMQHYGAPTRLLDWTYASATAAYFACINNPDDCGSIWWIDKDEVARWLDPQWNGWKYKRKGSRNQIDLNGRIDDQTAPSFVSMTLLPYPFDRAKAQRGLFTFGSQPGMSHDVQLKKQLHDASYGLVIIPKELKGEVIQTLKKMKIDAKSLQHAGADRVGLRMAWERELESGI